MQYCKENRGMLNWLFAIILLLAPPIARAFYDPREGRWLNRDPSGETGGANVHGFVRNCSPSHIDPLGLKAKLVIYDALRGERLGLCGGVEWQIWWRVEEATGPGWVVQEITITWDIKDKDNKPVAASGTTVKSPNHYWEAWQLVKATEIYPSPKEDTFKWTEESCTKGTVKFSGKAAFYEGATLPSTMTENNTGTIAGILPASTTDPNLTGGTAAVTHELEVKWDCTGCCPNKAKTELVKRTP